MFSCIHLKGPEKRKNNAVSSVNSKNKKKDLPVSNNQDLKLNQKHSFLENLYYLLLACEQHLKCLKTSLKPKCPLASTLCHMLVTRP